MGSEVENMGKLNKKGFTLIELLAVIVIMGILMMVAIPAMQRYMENSRKDMYVNTVKQYVDVFKKARLAGEIECSDGSDATSQSKRYFINFENSTYGGMERKGVINLLESGGKSPWDKRDITGCIQIGPTGSYLVRVQDTRKHYISSSSGGGLNIDDLDRSSIKSDVIPSKITDNHTTGGYSQCWVK